MSEQQRILIVGAGPAGLGAAWRLAALGHRSWRLVEAAESPGGLAAFPEEVRSALVSEWLDEEDHGKGIVVRSSSEVDQERVRMVLEARTHLPLEAAFASVAGEITYVFGDYRQVSEGLTVPFQRRFSRNGIQLSALTVEAFGVLSGEPEGQNEETQADQGGNE